MPKLTLELELDLYRGLQQAARHNQLSLEQECLRRLADAGQRRSHYMEALLADLRADSDKRRCTQQRPQSSG